MNKGLKSGKSQTWKLRTPQVESALLFRYSQDLLCSLENQRGTTPCPALADWHWPSRWDAYLTNVVGSWHVVKRKHEPHSNSHSLHCILETQCALLVIEWVEIDFEGGFLIPNFFTLYCFVHPIFLVTLVAWFSLRFFRLTVAIS